jgi:hypothetical protein
MLCVVGCWDDQLSRLAWLCLLPWPVSSLLFFFILFSFLVLITVLATGYKTDAINNFENL